jgi:C-methyltransferase C-terminal domain/Putative zinc binding domain/Methyltransferase domain
MGQTQKSQLLSQHCKPLRACRACGSEVLQTMFDLGTSPPSNSLIHAEDLQKEEIFYPLQLLVCQQCLFVQLSAVISPEMLFGNYRYFSSYSTSWLEHAKVFSQEMFESYLRPKDFVVEIASNDGYLLKNFLHHDIRILGIEPAENVAQASRSLGIPTISKFFGKQLAQEIVLDYGKADLIIANNVLAHVPDINDFLAGIVILLNKAPAAYAIFEFPHVLNLIQQRQFDTIYHEHYSYLALTALLPLLARHGLEVQKVEALSTHGGSLRLFVSHRSDVMPSPIDASIQLMLEQESLGGLQRLTTYADFAQDCAKIKDDFLEFLIAAKRNKSKVVGYGAAAKATTLLNYAGVRSDLIKYIVDKSPHKRGYFVPGTHIPIVALEELSKDNPDYVVIFPWNLASEIRHELMGKLSYKPRFVTVIPQLEING